MGWDAQQRWDVVHTCMHMHVVVGPPPHRCRRHVFPVCVYNHTKRINANLIISIRGVFGDDN